MGKFKSMLLAVAFVTAVTVPLHADIIDNKSENTFVGKTKSEIPSITVEEAKILAAQDEPAGYETYIFTHELILGTLLGVITAIWFYAFLTRKRPLF